MCAMLCRAYIVLCHHIVVGGGRPSWQHSPGGNSIIVSHWCFSRVYYILTTILKRSLYTIYYYILLFSCSLNCFTIFYHFFNVPLFRSRHAVSIYDLHLASLRLHTRKLLGRESDDGWLTRFGHVHYRNHLL